MTQQKLTQPMLGSKLILFGRFSSSNHIAQRLVRRVRHPYCGQLPGPIISRQFQRIPPVRLHAIPGLHRHQCRRHHFAFRSHPGQLPVQHVARRTRLITKPQLLHRPQFPYQLPNRILPIRNDPERPHLPVLLRYRYRNRLCMDIQTNKLYSLIDRLLSLVALYCRSSDSQDNPRPRIGAGHSIVTKFPAENCSE
jgi:hypothetical protein